MTLSVTLLASTLGSQLIQETSANATSRNNVSGGAGTLYVVDIDNIANVAQVIYLKIYDNAAPTVGTTPADWVFKVAAGVRRVVAITEGFAFSALSFAAVTGAAESSVTSPGAAVVVRLVTT